MPEQTQKEWRWLEHELTLALGWGGSTERIFERIVSAWPSSPQGMAVKQVMEVAEALDAAYIPTHEQWVALRAALEAAWKAGLG